MDNGWLYRVASVLGTVALGLFAVSVSNFPIVQQGFNLLPIIGKLPFEPAAGGEFLIEAGITTGALVVFLLPLYKPRPRRVLDIGTQAFRRVMITLFALATLGYFDFTFRLPRATLIVTGMFLLITVPPWFVFIRHRPRQSGDRTLIIGDDPETIDDILQALDGNVIGYVSSSSAYFGDTAPRLASPELADGGVPNDLAELSCLGGLSRLDDILVEYDIGTAVLAFAHPDRAEFFGALDSCYEHGVAAKAHRHHADVVLTTGANEGELIDIDLEPWDWQDRIAKRVFDVLFASTALLILSPAMLVIPIAIKLDSRGPILYRQTRTAVMGNTFTIVKFRSMVPEADQGATLSDEDDGDPDPRVTRVGRFLRKTHLDEIPQLLTILGGQMSVVGPRAAWTDEELHLEQSTNSWRKRWFVKPGLTGLAQINGATSTAPREKLRYDVNYIRRQSFWFDLKIVTRQLWDVLVDVKRTVVD